MSSPPASHIPIPTTFLLSSETLNDTRCLGADLARVLQPGDLVCISGELGAGKSELCRAIIRATLGSAELEVPSPSYTLVNVYDFPDGQIWHADLYRIGDESELDEIGLEDAIDAAIVLVEWPERWPDLPGRRLDIQILTQQNGSREIRFEPIGPNWDRITDRLKAAA